MSRHEGASVVYWLPILLVSITKVPRSQACIRTASELHGRGVVLQTPLDSCETSHSFNDDTDNFHAWTPRRSLSYHRIGTPR